MAVNAQKVDAYLGQSTFAQYQYSREVGAQLARHYEKRLKQAFSPNDGGLQFRLDDIGYIEASVETALEKVSEGKKVNTDQFWNVFAVYEAAIACAQAESDHLDAIFVAGFFPMLQNLVKQFPTRELKKAAEEERRAIKALEEALDKAKSQRREAIFEKVLDIGQLLVPFAAEVKLVEEAAVSFGGLLVDQMIGPGEPSAGKIARTSASTFGEPLAKVMGLANGVQKFAKTGGVLNGLYDAFADWGDVSDAFDHVDKVRAAIETEKKWRKYIIETIWANWAQRVQSLQNQLTKVKTSLEESAALVDVQRADYVKRYNASGYKRYLIWTIDR